MYFVLVGNVDLKFKILKEKKNLLGSQQLMT